MAKLEIQVQALGREAFAPFGDVIEASATTTDQMNAGAFQRFGNLARVEAVNEGHVSISIVRGVTTTPWPVSVHLVERHPLGSQAFIPLAPAPLLIVVAAAGETVHPGQLQAFLSNGKQGVHYHRGTWHMPMVALSSGVELLVVDRAGPGNNCEEHHFDDEIIVPEPGSSLA